MRHPVPQSTERSLQSPPLTAWNEFASGARAIAGPTLGTIAMGLITGAAMGKSGLDLPVILAMSFLVFASSSQLACLPLIASGAHLWLIVAMAFLLNLRFVVFSALWRPYLGHLPRPRRLLLAYFAGDPVYAAFVARQQSGRPGKVPYFLGLALTNWAAWQLSSLVGILAVDAIPASWGLQFVGALALLALTLPMLHDRHTRISAVVAGTVAALTASWPLGSGVLAAIALAALTGAWLDRNKGAA